jgi:hypothetical protein
MISNNNNVPVALHEPSLILCIVEEARGGSVPGNPKRIFRQPSQRAEPWERVGACWTSNNNNKVMSIIISYAATNLPSYYRGLPCSVFMPIIIKYEYGPPYHTLGTYTIHRLRRPARRPEVSPVACVDDPPGYTQSLQWWRCSLLQFCCWGRDV